MLPGSAYQLASSPPQILGERPAPRRAIVAVGIGTAEGTSPQPRIVADAVKQSGATLWVVSVRGRRT